MPDGVLQWYDARRGEGRVVRGGREYPVRAADMEPSARVPGAHVHFDVQTTKGVAVAVGVRLRAGTRVSRRQRHIFCCFVVITCFVRCAKRWRWKRAAKTFRCSLRLRS